MQKCSGCKIADDQVILVPCDCDKMWHVKCFKPNRKSCRSCGVLFQTHFNKDLVKEDTNNMTKVILIIFLQLFLPLGLSIGATYPVNLQIHWVLILMSLVGINAHFIFIYKTVADNVKHFMEPTLLWFPFITTILSQIIGSLNMYIIYRKHYYNIQTLGLGACLLYAAILTAAGITNILPAYRYLKHRYTLFY